MITDFAPAALAKHFLVQRCSAQPFETPPKFQAVSGGSLLLESLTSLTDNLL